MATSKSNSKSKSKKGRTPNRSLGIPPSARTLQDFPIVSKFQGLHFSSPRQANGPCPAHDDERDSFGVAVGDNGNLILKCFAGCQPADILRAVGETRYSAIYYQPRDESSSSSSSDAPESTAKPRTKSPPKLVDVRSFRDESGTILFEECRYDPKDFRMRQPDPAKPGHHIYSILNPPVRLVLYRLPELLASDPSQPVFILEGPRKADMLASRQDTKGRNFIATSAPGGSTKWQDSFTECLRGRRCFIIRDNDAPDPKTGRRAGWEHLAKLANTLTLGGAAFVAELVLPPIGDLLPPDEIKTKSQKWDLVNWSLQKPPAGDSHLALFKEAYLAACDRPWVVTDSGDDAAESSVSDGGPSGSSTGDSSGDSAGGSNSGAGSGVNGQPPTSGTPASALTPLPPLPNESDDDPHRLARIFLQRFQHPDGRTIHYWRDDFHVWNGHKYVMLRTRDIRCQLNLAIKQEFDRINLEAINNLAPGDDPPEVEKVSSRLQSDCLQALMGMTLLSELIEQPAWLPHDPACGHSLDSPPPTYCEFPELPERNPRDFIVMQNGILDIPRFMEAGEMESGAVLNELASDGDEDGLNDFERYVHNDSGDSTDATNVSGAGSANFSLIPPTPLLFTPAALPYPLTPSASCPLWESFVSMNLEGDESRINLLQEFFGYCLTFDKSQQKFLLMVGDGSNGKSVICAALTGLLGQDNCSHVPLEMFGKDFHITQTLGKLANIAAEIGEIDKMAEGILKSFTAGDRMTFNRKHQTLLDATPTARLVLSTNNLPYFSDKSEGIWRRILLLPLTFQLAEDDPRRVPGMDDPEWWASNGQLPGIFCWAIAGLQRLRERRRFAQGDLARTSLEDHRQDTDATRKFLTTYYEATNDMSQVIVGRDIYAEFRKWCDDNGKKPCDSGRFGRAIKKLMRRESEKCRMKEWDESTKDWVERTKRGYRGMRKILEPSSDGDVGDELKSGF